MCMCVRACACACVRPTLSACVRVCGLYLCTNARKNARERLCMRSIRFAVPLTPPPSRLTPQTQRPQPTLDPIRAPAVPGGTAPCAQLGCTCAAAVWCRACALRAAMVCLCALCDGAYACVNVFMPAWVRGCVRACVARRRLAVFMARPAARAPRVRLLLRTRWLQVPCGDAVRPARRGLADLGTRP